MSSRVALMLYICFFFFQAEDGIRDVAVTGVQTCALPILCDCQSGDTVARKVDFCRKEFTGKRKILTVLDQPTPHFLADECSIRRVHANLIVLDSLATNPEQ